MEKEVEDIGRLMIVASNTTITGVLSALVEAHDLHHSTARCTCPMRQMALEAMAIMNRADI